MTNPVYMAVTKTDWLDFNRFDALLLQGNMTESMAKADADAALLGVGAMVIKLDTDAILALGYRLVTNTSTGYVSFMEGVQLAHGWSEIVIEELIPMRDYVAGSYLATTIPTGPSDGYA